MPVRMVLADLGLLSEPRCCSSCGVLIIGASGERSQCPSCSTRPVDLAISRALIEWEREAA